MASQQQLLPYIAQSHAEITEQKAVKGVCTLSLGGIKDVEGLKRIKAGAMLPCHDTTPTFPFGLV